MNQKDILWGAMLGNKEAQIDLLLDKYKRGEQVGFSWGFDDIDRLCGRIQPSQVNLIGGYSGTGKSYFAINMISRILSENADKRPRLAVFSTEMSQNQYLLRHIAMLAGTWVHDFEQIRFNPELEQKVKDAKQMLFTELTERPESLSIFGNIFSWEQIESSMASYEKNGIKPPHVVIVDYVQALTIKGARTQQETMDIIGMRLVEFVQKNKCSLMLISQMNNYSVNDGYDLRKSSIAPFSNGKTLYQAASNALILTREKYNGIYSKHLDLHVVKAREGMPGIMPYRIDPGYVLVPITGVEANLIDESHE